MDGGTPGRAATPRLDGAAPGNEAIPSQGRLPGLKPIGVLDIGSNSVRLVVYEGLARSPTPLYNEKMLCGLGKGVATTGRLDDQAVEKAFRAIQRFRALAAQSDVSDLIVVATAAVRDAENGPAFIERAEEITGATVNVLSGAEEAYFSARGIVSGFHAPKGLVGDLGGGSLELVSIDGDVLDDGVSVPLGALRLREESEGSLKKAREITVKTLEGISIPDLAGALPFFAVGGTWRAFATLDMAMRGYRLRVLHQYRMKAKHVVALAREITSGDIDDLPGIEEVSSQRRALLPYGAIVLEEVVKRTNAQAVSISALGVREGLLFDRLPEDVQVRDPLIEAARDLAILRSRSVDHAAELCDWTDRLVAAAGVDDEPEDVRLRHAACWLADIGWRAHPDYRGEQSLNIIANAALMGIDHPGRAFLALTVFFRYAGYEEEQPGPGLKNLVSERLMNKARAVGAMMRVAYRLSAAMPGTLPRISFAREQGTLILKVPTDMRDLHPERVSGRYQKLCQALGLEGEVRIGS